MIPKKPWLLLFKPDKPALVAEFWDGWFDHWGEEHHVRDTETVANILKQVLDSGASFNLYMFHGVLILNFLFLSLEF